MVDSDHELDDETISKWIDQMEELGDLEITYDEETGDKMVKLTESGQERAYKRWRESDKEVLRSVQAVVEDLNPQTESDKFIDELIRVAKLIRDRGEVNMFRVLDRNPKAASNLGIGSISQDLIERFEPETDTDEEI